MSDNSKLTTGTKLGIASLVLLFCVIGVLVYYIIYTNSKKYKKSKFVRGKEIKSTRATRHGTGLQVPLPDVVEASTLRVGIVRTCWNEELIEVLCDKCIDQLVTKGVQKENIVQAVVPGSYELPYITKRMLDSEDFDVIICVGILLKGVTIHAELIADAVTNQLMKIQMEANVPVIFGLLTVLTIEQAVERAESDLAVSWADSALNMAMHKRRLLTDRTAKL